MQQGIQMRGRDSFSDRREIGNSGRDIGDLWVPKIVEARLVEAARLVVKTAGPVGPKQFGSGWPAFQREIADFFNVVFDAEGRPIGFEQIGQEEDRAPRLGATSRQITRMEQALRWPIDYLRDHDGPRRVLAVYLRCKAYRKPFGRACKRLGWSRATAYRARDKALSLIAQGLCRDLVPLDA